MQSAKDRDGDNGSDPLDRSPKRCILLRQVRAGLIVISRVARKGYVAYALRQR
jgi:hypothetical protein